MSWRNRLAQEPHTPVGKLDLKTRWGGIHLDGQASVPGLGDTGDISLPRKGVSHWWRAWIRTMKLQLPGRNTTLLKQANPQRYHKDYFWLKSHLTRLWNLLMSKHALTRWESFRWRALIQCVDQTVDRQTQGCDLIFKGPLQTLLICRPKRLIRQGSDAQPCKRSGSSATSRIPHTHTSLGWSLSWLHLWIVFIMTATPQMLLSHHATVENNSFICRQKCNREYFGKNKLFQESSIDSCSSFVCFWRQVRIRKGWCLLKHTSVRGRACVCVSPSQSMRVGAEWQTQRGYPWHCVRHVHPAWTAPPPPPPPPPRLLFLFLLLLLPDKSGSAYS